MAVEFGGAGKESTMCRQTTKDNLLEANSNLYAEVSRYQIIEQMSAGTIPDLTE